MFHRPIIPSETKNTRKKERRMRTRAGVKGHSKQKERNVEPSEMNPHEERDMIVGVKEWEN
jgi:hypothetical protein